jgi:uncharacterized cupredoxin-like copper-binding protein
MKKLLKGLVRVLVLLAQPRLWRYQASPIEEVMSPVEHRWQNLWRITGVTIALLFLGLVWPIHLAIATPLSKQTPLVKTMELGMASGELKFVPEKLTFQAGHRYQLTLSNPSPVKHYFTAKDFADAIWSQKVDAGNVEIKGAIHELELRPGSRADWVFIPLRAGTYQLHCTIPGHTEAGMVGTIKVTG